MSDFESNFDNFENDPLSGFEFVGGEYYPSLQPSSSEGFIPFEDKNNHLDKDFEDLDWEIPDEYELLRQIFNDHEYTGINIEIHVDRHGLVYLPVADTFVKLFNPTLVPTNKINNALKVYAKYLSARSLTPQLQTDVLSSKLDPLPNHSKLQLPINIQLELLSPSGCMNLMSNTFRNLAADTVEPKDVYNYYVWSRLAGDAFLELRKEENAFGNKD